MTRRHILPSGQIIDRDSPVKVLPSDSRISGANSEKRNGEEAQT